MYLSGTNHQEPSLQRKEISFRKDDKVGEERDKVVPQPQPFEVQEKKTIMRE